MGFGRRGVTSGFLDDPRHRPFASEAEKRVWRQQPGERAVDHGRIAEDCLGDLSKTAVREQPVQLRIEPLTLRQHVSREAIEHRAPVRREVVAQRQELRVLVGAEVRQQVLFGLGGDPIAALGNDDVGNADRVGDQPGQADVVTRRRRVRFDGHAAIRRAAERVERQHDVARIMTAAERDGNRRGRRVQPPFDRARKQLGEPIDRLVAAERRRSGVGAVRAHVEPPRAPLGAGPGRQRADRLERRVLADEKPDPHEHRERRFVERRARAATEKRAHGRRNPERAGLRDVVPAAGRRIDRWRRSAARRPTPTVRTRRCPRAARRLRTRADPRPQCLPRSPAA